MPVGRSIEEEGHITYQIAQSCRLIVRRHRSGERLLRMHDAYGRIVIYLHLFVSAKIY
jgi:hypothetical protein